VFLLGVFVFSLMVLPHASAAVVSVSVSPTSEVVSQYGVASYTVSVTGTPGAVYSLKLTGFTGSGSLFSPNPITAAATAVTSTLSINLGASGVCPGSYTFTVTATNNALSTDTSSSNVFSVTVTSSGPALQGTVTTDKSTYRLNDQVTILMNVNKPADARLTIQPPSGSPRVFDLYSIYGSTSKTLTADTVGRWSVTFEAEVCSEYSSVVAYFDVSPNTYDVSITLSGVPPNVSVGIKIDGTAQGTMAGSDIKKLTFPISTQHVLTLDQYVTGTSGVRYYCAQNTWNVGSVGSRTFEYVTQYQFTVGTNPDGVTAVSGGGWFSAGTAVQTTQMPSTVAGPAGTQYVFKGWNVDGALQNTSTVSLTMDKPHSAVATYDTQYQLLVDSQYGDPAGSGYYTAGSTATYSVTSPVGVLIQQVFTGWSGDISGTSPTGSITMDKPHSVHANWATSYFQLYILIGAIAAVVIVAALLMLRRGKSQGPPVVKPTPASTTTTETAKPSGEAVKCSSCGADVPVGQSFCQNCGSKMA
jgi:hypothetical protein